MIAIRSRFYHLESIDFTYPRIYDRDPILELKEEQQPKHIIIYGAGMIDSEYGSIFRDLDVKIDFINT